MKDRAHRKSLQRKLALYTPSPYTKALSHYHKTTAKSIDPLLRAIANRSPHARFFPLYEFLRAAARLFLLHELQLLMVAYRLEQQGWEVDDEAIVHGAEWMGQLFSCPSQRKEYRRVTLFILLVCYWAKSAMNHNTTYLLDEVRRICHNFSSIYQQWLGRSKQSTAVSPVVLNRLYSLLLQQSEPQYHYIVDQIVQLSHAYSSEREGGEGKKRGFGCREKEFQDFSEEGEGCMPRKRSFELNFKPPNLITIQSEQKEEMKEDSICVFGNLRLGQSQKLNRFFEQSYSNSMHFPSIQYSHKPEMDLDYIEVGLCQGESADLVILNPQEMTLPSIILGNRGVSSMENSMGLREISLFQLKEESEIFEKELRERAAQTSQKK